MSRPERQYEVGDYVRTVGKVPRGTWRVTHIKPSGEYGLEKVGSFGVFAADYGSGLIPLDDAGVQEALQDVHNFHGDKQPMLAALDDPVLATRLQKTEGIEPSKPWPTTQGTPTLARLRRRMWWRPWSYDLWEFKDTDGTVYRSKWNGYRRNSKWLSFATKELETRNAVAREGHDRGRMTADRMVEVEIQRELSSGIMKVLWGRE